MYASQFQQNKKSEKQLRLEHALSKMDKAISGTCKYLTPMGPVRSRQVVQSLRDAFNKVKVAGEVELKTNQSLKEEVLRQNRKIEELERQVSELERELREEERRQERQNAHLQQQITELQREVEQRDENMQYLLDNVRNALEAAFALYREYGLDEIDNDGDDL